MGHGISRPIGQRPHKLVHHSETPRADVGFGPYVMCDVLPLGVSRTSFISQQCNEPFEGSTRKDHLDTPGLMSDVYGRHERVDRIDIRINLILPTQTPRQASRCLILIPFPRVVTCLGVFLMQHWEERVELAPHAGYITKAGIGDT